MEQQENPTHRIMTALLSGVHLTTARMNSLGGTVDSRKIISRLRKKITVEDYWITRGKRRFKRYFCPVDTMQMNAPGDAQNSQR